MLVEDVVNAYFIADSQFFKFCFILNISGSSNIGGIRTLYRPRMTMVTISVHENIYAQIQFFFLNFQK